MGTLGLGLDTKFVRAALHKNYFSQKFEKRLRISNYLTFLFLNFLLNWHQVHHRSEQFLFERFRLQCFRVRCVYSEHHVNDFDGKQHRLVNVSG